MMKKGSKKENKIIYPRPCMYCEKVFGSPAGWHYHQQTHIRPSGEICSFGCGSLAIQQSSGGVWCCSSNGNRCPVNKSKISKRVKKDWETTTRPNPSGFMMTQTPERRKEIGRKSSETKRKKLIAQDNTACRRKYNKAVHQLSQYELRWNDKINPNSLTLSRSDNHLDHMVSKHVGFMLCIPPEILAHEKNLHIISSDKNLSKGLRCSKHPLLLLEEVKAPRSLINQVQTTIAELGDSFALLLVQSTQ